jgi:hypothetical protein
MKARRVPALSTDDKHTFPFSEILSLPYFLLYGFLFIPAFAPYRAAKVGWGMELCSLLPSIGLSVPDSARFGSQPVSQIPFQFNLTYIKPFLFCYSWNEMGGSAQARARASLS